MDLISELAFGQSFNTLENCTDSSLRGHFVETFDRLSEVLWTLIYFPTVRFIAKTLPPALAARVSPAAERSQNLLEAAGRTLAQFKSKQASGKTLEHEVVFDRLTGLSDSVLQEEAVGILVAGSDTTATTLSVALEQITRNPAIYRKLKQELSSAGLVTEGDYDLLGLEQLPYLVCCCHVILSPRLIPPPPYHLVCACQRESSIRHASVWTFASHRANRY